MPSDSIFLLRRAAFATAAAIAMVALPLSGCGVKGPLKLPQPVAPASGTLPAEPPAVPAPPLPAPQTTDRKP
jgi:predicted small lipoprotein YifL